MFVVLADGVAFVAAVVVAVFVVVVGFAMVALIDLPLSVCWCAVVGVVGFVCFAGCVVAGGVDIVVLLLLVVCC